MPLSYLFGWCGADKLAQSEVEERVSACCLAYRVADMDCALSQDLRAQAAAMSKAFDDLVSGQPLQVIARLAQTNATLYITDLELFSYKMIELRPV